MKKLLSIIALVCMAATCRADHLILKNNTGDSIQTALVWYNAHMKCWESKGWYNILPYAKQKIELKNTSGDTMYVYARSRNNKRHWRGDTGFQVDFIGFDIYYADQIKDETKKAMFTAVDVSKKETTYVFN